MGGGCGAAGVGVGGSVLLCREKPCSGQYYQCSMQSYTARRIVCLLLPRAKRVHRFEQQGKEQEEEEANRGGIINTVKLSNKLAAVFLLLLLFFNENGKLKQTVHYLICIIVFQR